MGLGNIRKRKILKQQRATVEGNVKRSGVRKNRKEIEGRIKNGKPSGNPPKDKE